MMFILILGEKDRYVHNQSTGDSLNTLNFIFPRNYEKIIDVGAPLSIGVPPTKIPGSAFDYCLVLD